MLPGDIQRLTTDAIRHRGDERGFKALEQLADLCTYRLPYDFKPEFSIDDKKFKDESLAMHLPGLLPVQATERIFERVQKLEQQGLLSTNPDSVDGLPSFHLNLVSNGEPVVDAAAAAANIPMEGDGHRQDAFNTCLEDLLDIVKPYIYEQLLPSVNRALNTTTIRVGDIFLRRYGPEIIEGEPSRQGISAHYDVFSRVTSVIALDDVAAKGSNGLFTTADNNSNHAALRRFFPLQCGDAVVHTWDVLHGVDVEPGLDRTSLIVWFTTSPAADEQQEEATITTPPQSTTPWLYQQSEIETNSITQFVLASAIESSESSSQPTLSTKDSILSSPKSGRLSSPSYSSDAMFLSRQQSSDILCEKTGAVPRYEAFDLYLKSAARGNTFALTRLGSLCSEDNLDKEDLSRAHRLAERLQKKPDFPQDLLTNDISSPPSAMDLAKTFWFEGAVHGNALAQMALADELMYEASKSGDADGRLLAATLFGLAAQQGNERALESLARSVEFDVRVGDYRDEHDFAKRSLVAHVANIACSRLA